MDAAVSQDRRTQGRSRRGRTGRRRLLTGSPTLAFDVIPGHAQAARHPAADAEMRQRCFVLSDIRTQAPNWIDQEDTTVQEVFDLGDGVEPFVDRIKQGACTREQ